jgi:hypothetical protein
MSAVAYELVHEAFETSAGDGEVALGLLAGSAIFFGAEVLIDRLAGGGHTSSGGTGSARSNRPYETDAFDPPPTGEADLQSQA